ncbi:MAG TPA: serine/threonine-protein kinase [Pirellulales bacterium]|nr:serine/threonine-protein kinase [Pirellulales bacterium]
MSAIGERYAGCCLFLSSGSAMYPPGRVHFGECALASGLVTTADIEQARAELRAAGIGSAVSPATEIAPAEKVPVEKAADQGSSIGNSGAEKAAGKSSIGKDSAEVGIGDRQLADKLIEMGRLNSYQADQLLNGRTKLSLGPYRILDSIAQGGMGQVFKAEHSMMGRVVAVKVLPRSKSTPEAIKSFTREIRVQAKLDHENLVRAFDAGHDGNVYFLVTEYIPGTDLRRYVRNRGKLNMHEAATIISQAAAGLQHAHELGLIHRDVKPGNILVTPDGQSKLSDLGLAGWLNDGEDSLHPGKTVGTADYLPPEQIMSPGAITPAGDIYSLGCTLYYAVTGKVPYPGGTTREKAHRHCTDTALHPRIFNPTLSDPFVEVLAAMMERDPKERIQSAQEVIRRLRPWAGDAVPAPDEPDETAGVPPRPNSPLPIAEELEDTAANFVDPILITEADAPSQASQRTDPVASAEQETLPEVVLHRLTRLGARVRSQLGETSQEVSALVLALAILAPIALVGVIWLIVVLLKSLGG